jgi:hypothetical protein
VIQYEYTKPAQLRTLRTIPHTKITEITEHESVTP